MDGVVDASVALKLVLAEAGSDEARALFAVQELVAPDILDWEVLNGLLKHGRVQRAAAAAVAAQHETITGAVAALYPARPRLPRALDIAVRVGYPLYDCVYLALAEELGLPLITADEAFCRKAAASGYRAVRPLVPTP